MDARAAQCASLETRSECLDAAMQWRDLARRALIHEQLTTSDPQPIIAKPLRERR